ncbi:Methyltransferase domain-containing protein [Geodermatophilus obscurus]|jgi:SAM-dependent methyltransferase|uniref:Methyltransferase domain-containing protein n=1 Tax=Geodermatophilus obscurus TaxID=1861 RepID=A0A1I5I9I0_9ACTN|nr:class I SAM-dependent methyltransferase [Geodermatophilus obscurus]SFO57232.1 Methyltransferase domain-containing protein [Geodermatophilus obscurus]
MAIDQDRLDALLGRFVTDVGAGFHAVNAVIGDRLGLYQALAATMPATAAEVARHAGADERHVREWLSGQAAGGYVTYDPETERFSLTEEQAFLLAAPEGLQAAAAFHLPVALAMNAGPITEAIRTGEGFAWHRHDPTLFEGTERFFRPGYAMNIASSWIPALEGVEERLAGGGRIADVGCGHGSSSLLMAQSYRAAQVVGFDYHRASIEQAGKRAGDAGLTDRVSFEVASAADFPGRDYDLVTVFDALHDMPDPLGAARHIRDVLAPDGTFMLVEPYAGDRLEDNLGPVGRLYYTASTAICVAHSMTEEPRTALGAQAGEARLTDLLHEAGFSRVRRAAETPFNLVLEVRP